MDLHQLLKRPGRRTGGMAFMLLQGMCPDINRRTG